MWSYWGVENWFFYLADCARCALPSTQATHWPICAWRRSCLPTISPRWLNLEQQHFAALHLWIIQRSSSQAPARGWVVRFTERPFLCFVKKKKKKESPQIVGTLCGAYKVAPSKFAVFPMASSNSSHQPPPRDAAELVECAGFHAVLSSRLFSSIRLIYRQRCLSSQPRGWWGSSLRVGE